MSYCRWSSDDYRCDAYVWEDVDGTWHTELADRRRNFHPELAWPDPMPPYPADGRIDSWWVLWQARKLIIDGLIADEAEGVLWVWEPVPEVVGGKSYQHITPGACAENLVRLQGFGIRVTQAAINGLRQEHADMSKP